MALRAFTSSQMAKLIIRHGLSQANNHENFGTPAFGNPQAPLMEQGQQQARDMGQILSDWHGIVLDESVVAVSTLRRTYETAKCAGFERMRFYSELDEVDHGLDYPELRIALETAAPPPAAVTAARKLLEDPPKEDIWIAHALLIATVCRELGVYQEEKFIPRFCEIRELPI